MSRNSDRDRPPRSRKSRPLGSEDEAIWRHVARTITPLDRAKPRVPDVEVEVASAKPGPQAKPSPPQRHSHATGKAAASRAVPIHTHKPPHPTPPPPPRKPAAPAGLPEFARRDVRRLASGRIEIEARLDLHGLTQSAAHARLVGFLTSAAAAGHKTVLVITGKGSRWRHDDDTYSNGADQGVLRRNVPRWLEEPTLRPLIVSFGSAARHHGGDGAFYVQLRRPGRHRGDWDDDR